MKKTLTNALARVCAAVPALAEEIKPVILSVSFGTSYNDSRAATIEAIESDIAAAFPDYEVRRAFTSRIIIKKLKKRDGLEIDSVEKAMDRLLADGVKRVVVQPTHIMPGYEYDDVVKAASAYADRFDALAIGRPMLYRAADYDAMVDAVLAGVPEARVRDTAVVFMGHGTEHYANAAYAMLEYKMHAVGYPNAFVGTVEGFPTIENVISAVAAYGAKKVVLYPFMIVAGDHANNDMAGEGEDSWKNRLTAAGFEVECRVQGLGENAGVRALVIEHVKNAIAEAGI